jgi:hypothetical protein
MDGNERGFLMRANRRSGDPASVAGPTAVIADSRFPSAVPDEDYSRYTRAVWRRGERWLARRAYQIGRESMGIDEALDVLWVAAARDLERRLNPQEERLLTELLEQAWPALQRWPDDAEPEIPAFLIPSSA